jgi:hypothetical protein
MKTIKKYSFLFKDLNTDEKQILGSGVIFILGAMFLVYLASTATPYRSDVKTRNTQTYVKPNYELPKSYAKYSNHVYNDKFRK